MKIQKIVSECLLDIIINIHTIVFNRRSLYTKVTHIYINKQHFI